MKKNIYMKKKMQNQIGLLPNCLVIFFFFFVLQPWKIVLQEEACWLGNCIATRLVGLENCIAI